MRQILARDDPCAADLSASDLANIALVHARSTEASTHTTQSSDIRRFARILQESSLAGRNLLPGAGSTRATLLSAVLTFIGRAARAKTAKGKPAFAPSTIAATVYPATPRPHRPAHAGLPFPSALLPCPSSGFLISPVTSARLDYTIVPHCPVPPSARTYTTHLPRAHPPTDIRVPPRCRVIVGGVVTRTELALPSIRGQLVCDARRVERVETRHGGR